jgi:hydroxyacylglutathione hydrolase
LHRNWAADAPGVVSPSLPSPLSLEIRINPFLRCDTAVIHAAAEAHAGKPLAGASDVFAVLRAWKDSFR